MDKVLAEVAEAITPNRKEREKLSKFAKRVIKLLQSHGFSASVEGSFAKDTWITGNHDIDFFMFFRRGTPKEELGKTGVEIGQKVIKELGGVPELAYSEHPYVRSKINGIDFDIVPCYKLKSTEQMGSAVDRTPFHTQFVLENLSDKQRREVRLLKQFTKGVGVYSAKEKVRGFSGYLCELLIAHYSNFKTLVRKVAAEWDYGLVIDVAQHHKNRRKVYKLYTTAMVVIDPTDKKRNVAAALDDENFEMLIQACENFVKNPSIQFFFPNLIQPYTIPEAEKKIQKHGRIIILKFKTPKLQEDILYSQLRRAKKMIIRQLDYFGFKVRETDLLSNDADSYLLFELEISELPKLRVNQGPPLNVPQQYQDAFVKKYKKEEPWIENNRWHVEVPRKYTRAEQLIEDIIKHPEQNGLPDFIIESLKKDHKLLVGQNILTEYKDEFARFLTRFLSKKQPWEW